MHHLVDEGQRQRLNALVEQLRFLLKVGDDRLPNLHTAHVTFGVVADDFALVDHIAIGEGDSSVNGIDEVKESIWCCFARRNELLQIKNALQGAKICRLFVA